MWTNKSQFADFQEKPQNEICKMTNESIYTKRYASLFREVKRK